MPDPDTLGGGSMTLTRPRTSVGERVGALDWERLASELDERGFAQTGPVLTTEECEELASLYDVPERFRATIDMARYRFGEGEYRYFDAPLPDLVDEVRRAFYPPLVRVANGWARRLGADEEYPGELASFLERCHRAGQRRPTPLMLRYREGGHNTLHQDLYGEVAFPLQIVTALNRPGVDFEGGQFVMIEQRPRAQSRAHVETLTQGGFLIFTTRHRPVNGARGAYRANLRHGVATVTAGERLALGVIFHDAA